MRIRVFTIIAAGLLLLSTSTVKADITEGLVAWYPLNGNASDASGNGKNGAIHGATTVADRFGNAGSALSFDGLNDYAGLPNNNPIWLPQDDFTVSAWVRFDRDPLTNPVEFVLQFDFNYYTNQDLCIGYGIYRNPDDGRVNFQMETATATNSLLSQDPMEKNSWYHIVGVRSGTTQEMYIDGQLDATGICSAEPIKFFSPVNDFRVNIGVASDGGWTTGTYYLDGMVDDVRIYNRALSSAEVQMLYNIPEPATLILLGLGAVVLRKRAGFPRF